jgi:O-antigen ligase
LVEYAYYVIISYGILANVLGLQLSRLAGGMIVVLVAFCVLHLGSRAVTVYAPIFFPLACAVALVVIQVAVHNEPLQNVKPFIMWFLTLILVHSLALRRGFLHRFVRVAFVIGLTVLPYLRYEGGGKAVARAGLDREMAVGAGLANANSLAAWFGFCGIYFMVVGIETRSLVVRMASWLGAIGCLFIVGLTVSRGGLLAFLIAAIVASRRLLKRGFIPILALVILGWLTYEAGLFQTATDSYVTRGAEETGRGIVWPLAIERFLSSPLAGVGLSNVETHVRSGKWVSPHNCFLYIALASGIVPLVFFLAYWLGLARAAFGTNAAHTPEARFQIPLLLYTFVVSSLSNVPFMTSWAIVALSVVRTAGSPRQLYRIKWRAIADPWRPQDAARYDRVISASQSFDERLSNIADPTSRG